jgi:hypothetical protein
LNIRLKHRNDIGEIKRERALRFITWKLWGVFIRRQVQKNVSRPWRADYFFKHCPHPYYLLVNNHEVYAAFMA